MVLKRFIYNKLSDGEKDSYGIKCHMNQKIHIEVSYQRVKKIHMNKLIEKSKRFIFVK